MTRPSWLRSLWPHAGRPSGPRLAPSLVGLTLALAFSLAGCELAMASDQHPCPPEGTRLTYQNFGQPFLEEHCQGCHGAKVGQRHGAPEAYNFGTHTQAKRHLDRIFARAADDNTSMPPGPVDPPAELRVKLGEWLGCGAP